ncbi:hypothetical protein JXQ70_19895 [bacterium]|nr:hypothetical protein [bacterium]
MKQKDLNRELSFVEKEKERLLKEYQYKFLLIQGEEVINSFDDYATAASEGIRIFGPDGVFLVHQVLEQEPVNFVMSAAL